jgi:hypothetical protein
MIRYLCFYRILLACLRNIYMYVRVCANIYRLSDRKVNAAKRKERQQLRVVHVAWRNNNEELSFVQDGAPQNTWLPVSAG